MKTVNFPEQVFAMSCVISFLFAINALFSLVPNHLSKQENWTMFYWSTLVAIICGYLAFKLHRKHHPFVKKDDASPPGGETEKKSNTKGIY